MPTARSNSFHLTPMAPTAVKAHSSYFSGLAVDSPENPFTTPALPPLTQIEAHIPTKRAIEQPSCPPTRQMSRSPDTSTTTLGSVSALVLSTSMETTHAFKSQHEGPRRVILQKAGQNFEADSFPVDFVSSGHVVNDLGRVAQMAGQKRPREQTDEDGYPVTRQGSKLRGKIAVADSDERRRYFELSGRVDGHQAESPASRFDPPSQANQPPPHSHEGRSAFEAVLNADIDGITREYMGEYEELVDRWMSCSREEWAAGAREISDKYAELMDSMKDHLLARVIGYEKLCQKLESQKRDLSDRQKAFKSAKEMYIEGSRSAIVST